MRLDMTEVHTHTHTGPREVPAWTQRVVDGRITTQLVGAGEPWSYIARRQEADDFIIFIKPRGKDEEQIYHLTQPTKLYVHVLLDNLVRSDKQLRISYHNGTFITLLMDIQRRSVAEVTHA